MVDITFVLPEECISHIISLTSPRDACRLSLVSPVFKAAADSDAVRESFLPSDYLQIISNSASSRNLTTCLSKKNLYFHLCHEPIIINNNSMSFGLDKESGKKCCMVGARGLSITWGGTSSYWVWPSLPESRFRQVAELKIVWWLEVKGRFETKILSPKTTYAVYLVFKFAESKNGFERRPIELNVYVEGTDGGGSRNVLLDPPANMPKLSQDRGDGWMEIEMGEIFNENGNHGDVMFSLFDFNCFSYKHGLIIEGIELRPKTDHRLVKLYS